MIVKRSLLTSANAGNTNYEYYQLGSFQRSYLESYLKKVITIQMYLLLHYFWGVKFIYLTFS